MHAQSSIGIIVCTTLVLLIVFIFLTLLISNTYSQNFAGHNRGKEATASHSAHIPIQDVEHSSCTCRYWGHHRLTTASPCEGSWRQRVHRFHWLDMEQGHPDYTRGGRGEWITLGGAVFSTRSPMCNFLMAASGELYSSIEGACIFCRRVVKHNEPSSVGDHR